MRQVVAKRLRRKAFGMVSSGTAARGYYFHEEGHNPLRSFFKVFDRSTQKERKASGSIRLARGSMRSMYQWLKRKHVQGRHA